MAASFATWVTRVRHPARLLDFNQLKSNKGIRFN
jgi:hypothetical protein